MAQRYAHWLAGPGVERGLIGPREADRLWPRHLLNCVAIAPLIPPAARVVDAGSGAGLPGIILAIARPDLDVLLVDAAARRCTFLREVVADLGLARVQVIQGRVEQLAHLGADVVTARALAPLPRLVTWCLPLVRPGGELLAIRGGHAAEELAEAEGALAQAGARSWEVTEVPTPGTEEVTTVIRVVAGAAAAPARRGSTARGPVRGRPGSGRARGRPGSGRARG